jgi:hypothetical protein
MGADAALDAARRQWAGSAQERLTTLVQAVTILRRAFEGGPGSDLGDVADPSEEVVRSCDQLASWLAGAKAPRGLGKAEGELGAAAGVFRNAAFIYRSLGDAGEEARSARTAAFAKALDAGDDLVRAFLATLAKRVPIDPS